MTSKRNTQQTTTDDTPVTERDSYRKESKEQVID